MLAFVVMMDSGSHVSQASLELMTISQVSESWDKKHNLSLLDLKYCSLDDITPFMYISNCGHGENRRDKYNILSHCPGAEQSSERSLIILPFVASLCIGICFFETGSRVSQAGLKLIM